MLPCVMRRVLLSASESEWEREDTILENGAFSVPGHYNDAHSVGCTVV